MTLATVSPDGRPSARVVLLKSYADDGFVFFTNYDSRKGDDLKHHPQAAILFYWAALARQVRVEGVVKQVAQHESDEYFASRPRASQIGAWASPQSCVIPDRASLDQRVEELTRQFEQATVTRPPHWGGFRLLANSVEFWQGRADRLHDRLRYRRCQEGGWELERLAP